MSKLNDVARASVLGGFLLFLGMTSSTIIRALNTILVARLLGPKEYGLYTIIMIVPTFFITLSDIGITPALSRFSALFHTGGEDRKLVNFIKAGILFKLAFSLVISFFLLLASEGIATQVLNRPNIASLIRLSSLSLIGQAVLDSISSTYVGLDEAGKSSLLLNFHALINIVTSPALIVFGFGVAGAVIGKSIGLILAASIGTLLLLLRTCTRLQKNNVECENTTISDGLKTMISFGAPLYLSTLIGSLNVQIKQILLTRFTSDIDIGNYRTAMNFSLAINLISSPIATVLFPAFSKLNGERYRDSIDKMFKLSVKYTALLVIPSSIILAVLSKNIVHLLYGPNYQSAPSYLALYMLNFLFTGLGMFVMGALFNGQGDTRTTLKISITYLVISTLLASILIPVKGVSGLILSILISQLIVSIYGLYLVNRMYRTRIEWSSSLKILAASLLSAFPVYMLLKIFPMTNSIYILILTGTLYIILLLFFAPIFRAIKEEDLKNFDNFTREIPFLYPFARYILTLEKKIIKLNSTLFHI